MSDSSGLSHKSCVSPKRVKLGVRWGWMKDRICRRDGHIPTPGIGVEFAGAWWPVCDRCGRGVAQRARAGERTFTVTMTMRERWVPQMLGLLSEMERLGKIGSSRTLSFFADGDGDFRPRFEWDADVEPAPPAPDTSMWDAG